VTITDSTFAYNTASSHGFRQYGGPNTVYNGEGGGLYNRRGQISINNSTFASNMAAIQGGGLYNASGSLSASASILANNIQKNENYTSSNNCSGTIADLGYNLESGTDCGFTQPTDQHNADPKLDPTGLQDNGGPTQTIALQPSSPAINKIPATATFGKAEFVCPATDQRGFLRPDELTFCDIGAYQSSYTAPSASFT
jgi:hypothetical protein